MLYSVHIKQRCDGQMNCKDQSDEIECRTVLIPTDAYLKTLPPPPVNGNFLKSSCFIRRPQNLTKSSSLI